MATYSNISVRVKKRKKLICSQHIYTRWLLFMTAVFRDCESLHGEKTAS